MTTAINVINLSEKEKGVLILDLIENRKFSSFYEELIKIKQIGSLIKQMSHFDGKEEDICQNPKYHKFNYPYHTHAVIQKGEEYHPGNIVMNLGCIFHDIGKGFNRSINKEGQPNDLNHEKFGIEPTKEALKNFGISQEIIDDVVFIVGLHGVDVSLNDMNLTPKEAVNNFTDKSVRKAIKKIVPYAKNNIELKAKLKLLFDFKKLDALGFQDHPENNFSKRQFEIAELAYPRFVEFVDKENFFATN